MSNLIAMTFIYYTIDIYESPLEYYYHLFQSQGFNKLDWMYETVQPVSLDV